MAETTWSGGTGLASDHRMISDVHGLSAPSDRPLIGCIGLVLGLYLACAAVGWPQAATTLIVNDALHAAEVAGAAHAVDPHHGHEEVEATPPGFHAVVPFLLLLGSVAALPLIPRTAHWWESNLNRFYVAAGLAAVTLAYYLVLHDHPIERHFLTHAVISPGEGALSLGLTWTVLQNAILNEYIPFITLLFALYTISGGIRISGDLRAHPLTNTAFIGIGGLLASFIGTTGAAMLLIRPLLQTNAERKYVRHTVIFFIFVVCNCGGLLLPIGDPPLFLGYLQGVDFLWTMSLWRPWLFVNGTLVFVYFVWDRFYFYRLEKTSGAEPRERSGGPLKIEGLWVGGPLLLGVVLSVALLDPTKTFPGTDWHPWLYLREAVQLALVGASLLFSSEMVRRANRFNYHAIVEVAALFFGIFICMQPALQILDVRGADLGINTPAKFFWATGSLSAVLDNAPTYLVFFKTAKSLPVSGIELMAGVAVPLLTAISLGAVFMGAMTYIGNGPNFMVKAIAEQSGVKMPSFFGYVLYSNLFLLPLFIITTLVFL